MYLKKINFRPRQLIVSHLFFAAYIALGTEGYLRETMDFRLFWALLVCWSVIGFLYGWRSLAHALSPIISWALVSFILPSSSRLESEGFISVSKLIFEGIAFPGCAGVLLGIFLGLGVRAAITRYRGKERRG